MSDDLFNLLASFRADVRDADDVTTQRVYERATTFSRSRPPLTRIITSRSSHRPRVALATTIIVLVAAVPSVALSRGLQQFLGLVSSPPVARNWVQATLTSPVPTSAAAGSTVVIRWKLWSRDQDGKILPFDAGGLFARLINPAHTRATTSVAHGHNGQYSATIRVPSGGIGTVQLGLVGWSSGPSGRKPAPNLFPITNYP